MTKACYAPFVRSALVIRHSFVILVVRLRRLD